MKPIYLHDNDDHRNQTRNRIKERNSQTLFVIALKKPYLGPERIEGNKVDVVSVTLWIVAIVCKFGTL